MPELDGVRGMLQQVVAFLAIALPIVCQQSAG